MESSEPEYVTRPLSARESQIVAWLELTRPELISAEDLVDEFSLSRATASDVLRRMAAKNWLHRVSQGWYEPLLANTGGWSVANPWATLSAWRSAYFVGYLSAAYVRGFTPDRPAAIQACVPFGTSERTHFDQKFISLVRLRNFSTEETETLNHQGFDVRVATPSRIVFDGAANMRRMNGAFGFARVLSRSYPTVDWTAVVSLSTEHPHGKSAVRRIGAMLDVLSLKAPSALSRVAVGASAPTINLVAQKRQALGNLGKIVQPWNVRLNVPAEAIREELRR